MEKSSLYLVAFVISIDSFPLKSTANRLYLNFYSILYSSCITLKDHSVHINLKAFLVNRIAKLRFYMKVACKDFLLTITNIDLLTSTNLS